MGLMPDHQPLKAPHLRRICIGVLAGVGMLLALCLAISSCDSSGESLGGQVEGAGLDLTGRWSMVEVNDEPIVAGINTVNLPILSIDQDVIGGELGCNQGSAQYAITGNTVIGAGVAGEAQLCGIPDGSDTMVLSERALVGLLAAPDGFEVSITPTEMRWVGSAFEIVFSPVSE